MKWMKESEPTLSDAMKDCCCLERPKPDMWLQIKTTEGYWEFELEKYALDIVETEEGLLTRLHLRFLEKITFGDINALIRKDYQQNVIEHIAILLKGRCIYSSSSMLFYSLEETIDTYLCRRYLMMELHDLVERPDGIESKITC